MSILTHKYRTFLAQQMLSQLSSNNFSAYMFIGRVVPWVDAANVVVSDTNPPTVPDDVQDVHFEFWRDMLGAKRLSSANTQFVIARNNWTSGLVYDQYDDRDTTLSTKRYYAIDMTSIPHRVYKCLWNNNGAISNVAPSVIGAPLIPTTTADGYVWQYMYTVTSVDYKFLSASWMPVLSDSTVQANALTNLGKLPLAVPLVIVNAGSGYNASATITSTVIGDGTGATITANGVVITGGVVTRVTLASGGNGYSTVTSINVYQSGASSPASLRAIIPPYPNHGYNPLTELNAAALMFAGEFTTNEGGKLTTANAYRRIGLLINPALANSSPANALFYRQTTDVTISANTGVLLPNDIVRDTTKNAHPFGTVVDVVNVANNYIVRLTAVNDVGLTTPFDPADILHCDASGVEVTVANVSPPELKWFSGDIVWVNQRTPVTRAPNQTDEIKIVFPFR